MSPLEPTYGCSPVAMIMAPVTSSAQGCPVRDLATVLVRQVCPFHVTNLAAVLTARWIVSLAPYPIMKVSVADVVPLPSRMIAAFCLLLAGLKPGRVVLPDHIAKALRPGSIPVHTRLRAVLAPVGPCLCLKLLSARADHYYAGQRSSLMRSRTSWGAWAWVRCRM